MNEVNTTNTALNTAQYNALMAGSTAPQGAKILIHPALQGLMDADSNLALKEPTSQSPNNIFGQSLLDGTPRQQERMIIDALIRTLNVVLALVTKVVDLFSQKVGNNPVQASGGTTASGAPTPGATDPSTAATGGSQSTTAGTTDGTTPGSGSASSASGTTPSSGSASSASGTTPTETTAPGWADQIKGLGDQGKAFLDGAKELISQFSEVAVAIGAIFLGKGAGIFKLGKGLFKNAKKIFKTLSKGAGELFSKGKDFFKENFGGIIEGGKSLFKKIF